MTSEPFDIYVDSCVHVSYLNGNFARTPHIEALYRQARAGEVTLYTSTVALTEVSYILGQLTADNSGEIQDRRIDRILRNGRLVKLVNFNQAIAVAARQLVRESAERRRRQGRMMERALKPLDAIHLASAQAMKVHTFLAYDTVYRSLRAEFPFDFAEPSAGDIQARMNLQGESDAPDS